jgi:hypothetical protein
MKRIRDTRASWWAAAGLDREFLRYRFRFTADDAERCVHVSRLGIRCFRPWRYEHFCGLHNWLCRHDGNKHPARKAPQPPPQSGSPGDQR